MFLLEKQIDILLVAFPVNTREGIIAQIVGCARHTPSFVQRTRFDRCLFVLRQPQPIFLSTQASSPQRWPADLTADSPPSKQQTGISGRNDRERERKTVGKYQDLTENQTVHVFLIDLSISVEYS